MKKVLFFSDFSFIIGGSNKVLLTQANIMQQKGYTVLFVIPDDKNGRHIPVYDLLCELYGLKVITAKYPVATCMECISILDVVEAYDDIKKIISDYKPDLIHSTQLNITVELVARELKIPHLMNIYQADQQEFLIDWLNIYPQYHSADSDFFSKRWGEGLNVISRCVRIAYDRSNNLLEKAKNKTGQVNVVAIGVLCERKNQMEIIKFILKCRTYGQEVKLTILGEANNVYGDKCKRFVEKNDLQDFVIFAGFVLNIEDYLKTADLLVVASTVESYPGVVVESMANKVPIISTPVAGVPELLKDGENGFLTNGFEADDIYQSFLKYKEYRINGNLSHIVDRAYMTYLKYHTNEEVGNQLDDYYKWIMKDYSEKEKSFLEIEDVSKIFNDYLFDKNVDVTDVKLRYSLWFLYHIFSIMEKRDNVKIIIWGAGMWGSVVLEWIQKMGTDKWKFTGFIDKKKRGMYLGYPIIQNIDRALIECSIVIVAVAEEGARLEIMNYLDMHGKVRNKDYFMICNDPVRI